eukprot:scaffold218210_cov47-Prasinocladus_malaysianus.AAC.1
MPASCHLLSGTNIAAHIAAYVYRTRSPQPGCPSANYGCINFRTGAAMPFLCGRCRAPCYDRGSLPKLRLYMVTEFIGMAKADDDKYISETLRSGVEHGMQDCASARMPRWKTMRADWQRARATDLAI